MCIGGGGGSRAPATQGYFSNGSLIIGEPGLPQEAIDNGITTQAGWQSFSQQRIADQQIAAQKDIAQQQTDFNTKQLDEVKQIQAQQQQAVDDQALKQSTYNQGQTQALGDASKRINDAFGVFGDDYFNQYANDYMNQVNDQLGYQRTQADKQLAFGLARQGISDSQQRANATGLLDETQGRTIADEIGQAQQAAGTLRSNVGQAKQSLLGQVATAQSVGPPIATSSLGDVNSALNQQNQQISGIAANAGDVVASLKGVPTVSSLGNIFSALTTGTAGYLGGVNSNNANAAYKAGAGLGGTNPNRVYGGAAGFG